MKITVVGAGNVGGTLGRRWEAAGHQVRYAGRDDIPQAVAGAEVVVLATPWKAMSEVAAQLGGLKGTVLVDATNPIGPGFSLERGPGGESGAEWLARLVPGARVVKAFNTIGFNIMADPAFAAGPATLCYCGDDAGARQQVRQLATDLGFEPVDAGPLAQARLLEPFALLWITLAMKQGMGREIAFRLMRR
jgi:predicted dinucleotide-binding enzyme